MDTLQSIIDTLLYNPKDPLLFNSMFFLVFFALFFAIYNYFLNDVDKRIHIVILFSLYFFYKACGWYVICIIGAAIVDFYLSNKIHVSQSKRKRKWLLILSLLLNLGFLSFFKYTNLFIETVNHISSGTIRPLELILPIGISFYTFENISYTIDVYRKKFEPVKSFREYLFFLSFFPKLMMGPIVRAADFIPQIRKKIQISNYQVNSGLYLIAVGVIKKMIISDYLYSNFVERIFDNPSLYTGAECLLAVYGYAMVIYCDFSGYSNIALGMARWMGFEINENFDSPYQSKSITEFWRRWHISLSSWLKDYLYIPLGGNQSGKLYQYRNLFITMLLGGLWHGASWNFVAWGGMHGAALGVDKIKNETLNHHPFLKRFAIKNKYWLGVVGIVLTFHFVCFCWIFFKSDSFETSNIMIRKICTEMSNTSFLKIWMAYSSVIIIIASALLFHFIPRRYEVNTVLWLQKRNIYCKVLLFISILILVIQFKQSEPILPVYLQF